MTDAYEAYVRSRAYREERACKADVILTLCEGELGAADSIADLGAGTGLIKRALEETTGKTIVGFDIDESFIRASDRMIVADVRELPARDGRFDFLLLNPLYEHVSDPARLFEEAYRVLRAGGAAYVSAGNRLAVLEPHYRLPFLSWLPELLATRYLRLSGRGESYAEIRFRTYRSLVRLMLGAGFRVHDITERALRSLLDREEGRGGRRAAWRALAVLPATVRRLLLQALSPQWFFLLEKPREGAGRDRNRAAPRGHGRPGE